MYVLGVLILTPLKTEIGVKLIPDMLGGLQWILKWSV
jgi:hypothetical protein